MNIALRIIFLIFMLNLGKISSCFTEEELPRHNYSNLEFFKKPKKSFVSLVPEKPSLKLSKKHNTYKQTENISKKSLVDAKELYKALEKHATIALSFHKKIDLDYALIKESNLYHIFEYNFGDRLNYSWKKQFEYIIDICQQRQKNLDFCTTDDIFLKSSAYSIGLFLNDLGYRLNSFLEEEYNAFINDDIVIKSIFYKKFINLCVNIINWIFKIEYPEFYKNLISSNTICQYFNYIYQIAKIGEPIEDIIIDKLTPKIIKATVDSSILYKYEKSFKALLKRNLIIFSKGIFADMKRYRKIKFECWYLEKLNNTENLKLLLQNNENNLEKLEKLLKELVKQPDDIFDRPKHIIPYEPTNQEFVEEINNKFENKNN